MSNSPDVKLSSIYATSSSLSSQENFPLSQQAEDDGRASELVTSRGMHTDPNFLVHHVHQVGQCSNLAPDTSFGKLPTFYLQYLLTPLIFSYIFKYISFMYVLLDLIFQILLAKDVTRNIPRAYFKMRTFGLRHIETAMTFN